MLNDIVGREIVFVIEGQEKRVFFRNDLLQEIGFSADENLQEDNSIIQFFENDLLREEEEIELVSWDEISWIDHLRKYL